MSDSCFAFLCLREGKEGVIGDGGRLALVLLPDADRESEEGEDKAEAELGRSRGGGRVFLRGEDEEEGEEEDEEDGTAMLVYDMLSLVLRDSTGRMEDGGGGIWNSSGTVKVVVWHNEETLISIHASCSYIPESNSPCSASLADWMGRFELFAVFSEEKRETSGCITSLSSSGFSCGVCQC